MEDTPVFDNPHRRGAYSRLDSGNVHELHDFLVTRSPSINTGTGVDTAYTAQVSDDVVGGADHSTARKGRFALPKVIFKWFKPFTASCQRTWVCTSEKAKLSLHRVRRWSTKQQNVSRLHFYAVLLVTTINIIWTAICALKLPKDEYDMTILKNGNCETVERLNLLLHLLINILSTALLWGAGHAVHLLLAPTRKDVDRAHKRGLYFDIGVSSLKNFWRVPSDRRIAIACFMVCSSFLHLLLVSLSSRLPRRMLTCGESWNSAIFTTKPIISYGVAWTTSDFMTNKKIWNQTLIDNDAIFDFQQNGRNFTRLTTAQCLTRYCDIFTAGTNVVVVTDLANNSVKVADGTSLLNWFFVPGSVPATQGNIWTCRNVPEIVQTEHGSCDINNMRPYLNNWTLNFGGTVHTYENWAPAWTAGVEYCLSGGVQPVEEMCGLYFRCVHAKLMHSYSCCVLIITATTS
jgi:hypothetical protein